jgi:uncharacterized protein YndB with AHSA1/START domain
MARSELVMAASPEDVWKVLAHPPHYAYWVVGSSEIRDWDHGWPEAGSRFHHRVGAKPFTVADHTEVVESTPPRRLILRAKARPFGVARVDMRIEPHPAGSLVTMVEDPEVPMPALLVPPPVHALLRLRNGESLRRLRRLAEDRLALGARRDEQRAHAHAGQY